MDVSDPLWFNPRAVDASYAGANAAFVPGGATVGGVPEILTDPLPDSHVVMTPVVEGASGLSTVAHVGGRVLLVAGAAYDAYSIVTAENPARQASSVAGGWAGAWAGGEAGAALGAGVGAWFAGAGAVPGAVIGGIAGGVVGYFAGSKAGTNIYDVIPNSGTAPATQSPSGYGFRMGLGF